MSEPLDPARPSAESPYHSARVRNYFLGIMTLTYALNLFDRQIGRAHV